MTRTFRECSQLLTFDERFDYLKLNGKVGSETFGFDRYLNQSFYQSPQWRSARNEVIIRDSGCDLGVEGYLINGRIYIHHIVPITIHDLEIMSPILFDTDNLICTSFDTHQAIHYGDKNLLPRIPEERTPYDTCPWRRT